MKLRDNRKAAAALALAALATPQAAARAEDVAAEIRQLKEAVKQLEPLKARLKQLEAEIAKQKRQQKEAQAPEQNAPQGQIINAAAPPGAVPPPALVPPGAVVPAVVPPVGPAGVPPVGPPVGPFYRISPPMPVFVSLERGLTIVSTDGDFSFHVGGRLFVDGGFSTDTAPRFLGTSALAGQPASGDYNQVGIRYARLQVLGSAFRIWDYKFQYDFTGAPNGLVIGGLRDAYVMLRYPDPFSFIAGNFFEPFSLERTESSNFRDFIERGLPSDLLAPSRHLGLATTVGGLAPGIGVPNWSFRGGIFSTSLEDGSPSATGAPAAGSSSFLQPVAGGSQYWEASGRFTYAPILTEEDLLNVGGSFRYQRPNDATAASDDRVLQPGSTLKTEENILNMNLLGTQPLTCVAASAQIVGENCVKNVENYGFELVASHGPFSVQAEYLGMHYNRDAALIEFLHAPGGTSVNFSGYYVYATWYLTGESRADAFRTYPNRYLNPEEFYVPSTFGQIKILRPFSAGGPGAWELAARLSEINLNSGGYLFLQPIGVPSNIQGGRETDFTLGLNWYPDPGYKIMANWTDVLQLSAPYNRPNINGFHSNLFELRVAFYW
jgi:phosphate-selective porin OprO and OprP